MGNSSSQRSHPKPKKSFVVVPPSHRPAEALLPTFDGPVFAAAISSSPKNHDDDPEAKSVVNVAPPFSPVVGGTKDLSTGFQAVEEFGTDDGDDGSPNAPLAGRKKSELKANSLVATKEENQALIFIKPAVCHLQAVRDVIDEHLVSHKCELTSEGMLTSETILRKGIIDKHYSALAVRLHDLFFCLLKRVGCD